MQEGSRALSEKSPDTYHPYTTVCIRNGCGNHNVTGRKEAYIPTQEDIDNFDGNPQTQDTALCPQIQKAGHHLLPQKSARERLEELGVPEDVIQRLFSDDDSLTPEDVELLDETTWFRAEDFGLDEKILRARDATDECFFDEFRTNKDKKFSMAHIDLMTRDPDVLHCEKASFYQRVARDWAQLKATGHGPGNPVSNKGTPQQYKEFEETLIELGHGEDLNATTQTMIGTPDDKPATQTATPAAPAILGDENLGQLGSEATETVRSDFGEHITTNVPATDRVKWELEKIAAVLRCGGSLTHNQIVWAANHIPSLETLSGSEREKLAYSRAFMITDEEEGSIAQADQSFTKLDDFLHSGGFLERALNGARVIRDMVQCTYKRGINPFSIGAPGPNQDERGRVRESNISPYFELTAFERSLRSGSRERSLSLHRKQGTFTGRRGSGVHPQTINHTPFSDDEEEDLLNYNASQNEILNQLPRAARDPTIPGQANEQDVIATYGGQYLKDQHGNKKRIPLNGDWFLRVWRLNTENRREVYGPMRVIRKRVRACQLLVPKEGAKKLHERLPTATPINGRHIRSLYVGISAISGQLVYVSTKKGEIYQRAFKEDDFTGLVFKAEPSQTLAGSNTILTETNIIEGNLARTKQYVAGQTNTFNSENDPEGKATRQNEKVHQYLPPRSLQHTDINSKEGIPNMAKFYKKDGIDTHWAMSLIPLGAFTVPLELVNRLKTLLMMNPLDPMSINTAIQAVSLYLRTKDSINFAAEGFAYTNNLSGQLRHPVPMVDLEVFIIYFPHFLRWHEIYGLTRYMHPFRFIAACYRLDRKAQPKLALKADVVDEGKMRHLIRVMTSSCPNLASDHTVAILPASWPGSQMKWPSGVTTGEPPSRELFKLCMLDDVRTLGLPLYHPRATETQLVALPITIANGITKSQGMKFFVPQFPSSTFWKPSRKGTLVSLSGGAETIGPVFKPVDGKEFGPLEGEEGLLGEGNPSWIEHSLPHPISHLVSRHVHMAINRRNIQRLELLKLGNLVHKTVKWDDRDSVLTWDGLQSEVITAVANNELPALRLVEPIGEVLDEEDIEMQDAESEPGEAAEFHLGPREGMLLESKAANEIREILSRIPNRATDWDPLMETLEVNEPLYDDLVTHLHRLWADLVRPVASIGRQFWQDKNNATVEEIQQARKQGPQHLIRLLGLLDPDDATQALEKWPEWKDEIPEEFLPLWTKIDIIRPILTDERDETWLAVRPSIANIYNSQLCRGQIEVLEDLVNMLQEYPEDWTLRRDASNLDVEIEDDLYTAD
ncbi:hypothetical protein LB504_007479 [Fusarium proliferatum]|nr:hypothetical protein LB504_007479 [Fusarium proliferatum]